MKKGIKLTAASFLALSALTPAVVFANEAENTVASGIYTSNGYISIDGFKKLSTTEKVAYLQDESAVVVVGDEALKANLILTATDAQIAEETKTVQQYQEDNGVELTPGGVKEKSSELTVESVMAINSTQVEVTFNKEVKEVKPANFKVTDKDGNLLFVSKVELSEDKKVATLSFFEKFVDKGVYTVETTNVVDVEGNKLEKSTNQFGYEVAEVAKVEFTTTTVKPGDKLSDFVKVTDKLGRDVTSEYTLEFASADNSIINASGEAQNVNGKEVLVTVKVKDTNVTAKAVIKVSISAAKTFVGYSTDSSAADTDAFKKLEADKIYSYVSVTDKDNRSGGGSDDRKVLTVYTLDQYGKSMPKITSFDSVENLTPNVVIVDATTGKITPVSEGTGYVKIKTGSVEQTIRIDVRAAAQVTDIEIDPTEVNVVEKGLAGELKLTYKDQFGGKTSGVLNNLTVKSGDSTIATVEKVDTNTIEVKGLKTGTTTITLTYKYTVDNKETVIEKTVPVTVSEKGNFADYIVEVPRTTLYSEDDNKTTTINETEVVVKAFQIDDKGQKIANASIKLVALDKDEDGKEVAVDDNANDNRVKIDGTKVSFKKAGTQKVQVKVGDVVIETIEFTTINNTPGVPENVVFDNNAIVVGEIDKADPDAKNIEKQLAKIVTLKDKFGDDVELQADDAINFEYIVTNKDGVTFDDNDEKIVSLTKQNATADIVVTKVTFTPDGGSATENLLATPQVVKLSVKDTTFAGLEFTSSANVTNLVLTAKEDLGYDDNADLKDHFILNVAAEGSTATIASAKYDANAKTITFTITDSNNEIAADDTISVKATLVDAAGNKATAGQVAKVVDASGLKWATVSSE